MCLPSNHGRVSYFNVFGMARLLCRLMYYNWRLLRASKKDYGYEFFDVDVNGPNEMNSFNTNPVRQGEIPSSNCHANARGLGKLAAAMANCGSIKGETFLSPSAWALMHADSTVEYEPNFTCQTNYTQGGIHKYNDSELKEPKNSLDIAFHKLRSGYYGWKGIGGSVF